MHDENINLHYYFMLWLTELNLIYYVRYNNLPHVKMYHMAYILFNLMEDELHGLLLLLHVQGFNILYLLFIEHLHHVCLRLNLLIYPMRSLLDVNPNSFKILQSSGCVYGGIMPIKNQLNHLHILYDHNVLILMAAFFVIFKFLYLINYLFNIYLNMIDCFLKMICYNV